MTGAIRPAEHEADYYPQRQPSTGCRTRALNRVSDPPVLPPLFPERSSACRWVGLSRGGLTTQSITQRMATNGSGHQFPADRALLMTTPVIVTVPLSAPLTKSL